MTITKAQYFQLMGLLVLGERLTRQGKEIEKAVSEIVMSPGADADHVNGHVMDAVYGSRSLDELLKLLEIEVAP